MEIVKILSKELDLQPAHVENTLRLIDDGNTIPFIARYRKEATGSMSDETLRAFDERLRYLRGLEERKEEVLRLIGEQGKLTDELKRQIEEAEMLQRVEDLYKPFRQKKATRASKAREKGLEPLAELIWAQETFSGSPLDPAAAFADPEKGVETPEEALQGAMDILAERISDDPDLTALLREKTVKEAAIVSEAADPEESTVYDMYYDRREKLSGMPGHRILAVNRGEKEKKLKVRVEVPAEAMVERIRGEIIKNEKSVFTETLEAVAADAYKRLIAPSLEREMRKMLTEKAEAEAVKVFARNTEKLLMTPPVKGATVISIDPGFRTGCKVAVLDETGKLRAYTTVYPTEPRRDVAGTEAALKKLIEKYGASIIAIGNGTASRETEEVVAAFLKKTGLPVQYTIVNEAGASVYSASRLAAEEYPDLDVTTRGAMSLGRRLQDPLAELVKISPKHIGVGQYQHDINQSLLEGALTNVVEDCVNRVGVDLNTASPSLLSYIAGINGTIARNIVAYREENGAFRNRKELKKVAKLGEKTFQQCAGFLRITGGENPLDATSVHPESYAAAEAMLERLGIEKHRIGREETAGIETRIGRTAPRGAMEAMARELGIGVLTLKDIVAEIRKPGRDPREDAPPVVFRSDVRRFEDLAPGMELTGTVRNVVDFGAFVDIGVKNDGLVHISQMSKNYIKHPLDAVSVGDTVKVKILSVDPVRQKISLTMKN